MQDRSNKREREAWHGGVEAADRILRETIRKAMDTLSHDSFMVWLRGFVGKGEKD